MKKLIFLLLCVFATYQVRAQLYYPPNTGTTWQTTDPSTLGWCQDSIDVLYDYLETTHSKAFLLLKDGRIVLERYFGTFTADSLWVWNSAGKTLTAFAVGIAQEEGYLSIDDTTSAYLGTGWTSLTPEQEEKITIRHQLTMTSGLDDAVDFYCTDPACLQYLADPGQRWAYHNSPYTLLDDVIANATGMTLNAWTNQKIRQPIGMNGFYFPVGYNNVHLSNARSMARFGLLLLSEGIWNGTPVLDDPDYFEEMTTSSQTINPSYGYLTWLNGQSSFMIPQLQVSFPGSPLPNAPDDMYAALGKDGQIINVVPSTGMVVVRMGLNDGNSLVASQYNDTIWQYINRLSCTLQTVEWELDQLELYPNPSNGNEVTLDGWKEEDFVQLTNNLGQSFSQYFANGKIHTALLTPGIYFLSVRRAGSHKILRLSVN